MKGGEPVFPLVVPEGSHPVIAYGISARDWLAAMAMQGMLANPAAGLYKPKEVALLAFKQADEFLKQSEVQP